jgi:hypothetical protein
MGPTPDGTPIARSVTSFTYDAPSVSTNSNVALGVSPANSRS